MTAITTIEAPASVFRTYCDALGLLRRTYKNYDDPHITREGATALRSKLGEATDSWSDGIHTVELTDHEIDLLWSGVSDILFTADSNRQRRRAHRAADHLVFSDGPTAEA